MKRIRALDEETVNKIAAGEVIERPASVVKELVENSIDAGAHKVLIEVRDGGKSFIKVTDDGSGIDPDDLPLAFQKHTTSKISGAQDLETIGTLGFRGEALASIASVSEAVEVRTKTRDALSGSYLRIENGKVAETKEVGSPVGTSIVVWNLFSNVPARRKHLKGREAELVHIIDVITELAIIHYDIAFELFSGSRTHFKSARSNSWDDVLSRIFGLKAVAGMAPLQASGRGWRIEGMIGDAFSLRASSDRIFIFVNGRAVSSRSMAGALREAYRNIIPPGKSPIAVLSLEISPDLVDVNVHPAKREIRLLHENEICSAVTQEAALTLSSYAKSVASERLKPSDQITASEETLAQNALQSTLPLDVEEDTALDQALPEREKRSSLKILGQIKRLYIVAESDQGLVLIDQHAAAERIRFEGLEERYREGVIRQELACPVTIELMASEEIMLSSWKEVLDDIGFEISSFGGRSYSVRSVPALGQRTESAESVHDVLKELFLRGKPGPDSSRRDEVLKLLACRGSIKSGKELTLKEMEQLLHDLQECSNPTTCPHGRPVMVILDQSQLERLFGRR
ncbi:DNA mismatch repair endonuclease MutL [Methanothrix sp.]|uniref:DNA mismatch repair endonuclease MutL n=1 Tax=Methanothrix sp. TaxID=90426 RepID=UPI001E723291|nr:DNA mismatch repair endonuclease MutL [Methanothrix sp.]UEC41100.1 MAG: DNA mismatch repair protein MutL [Methanothrix sp.]